MGKRHRAADKCRRGPTPRGGAPAFAGATGRTALLDLSGLRMHHAERAGLSAVLLADDWEGLLAALASRPNAPDWILLRTCALGQLGRRAEMAVCAEDIRRFGRGVSELASIEAEVLKDGRYTHELDSGAKAELAGIYRRGLATRRPSRHFYLDAANDWCHVQDGRPTVLALLRRAHADWPDDRGLALRYADALLRNRDPVAALAAVAPWLHAN